MRFSGDTEVTGDGETPGLGFVARACPSRTVLEQLADKWSLLVLGVLDEKPMRFNELRRAVDGVSHRMLTRTLRRHQQLGFVHREVSVRGPLYVEYSLTPLGRSLREPVRALWRWTEDHIDEVTAAEESFAELGSDRGV